MDYFQWSSSSKLNDIMISFFNVFSIPLHHEPKYIIYNVCPGSIIKAQYSYNLVSEVVFCDKMNLFPGLMVAASTYAFI